MWCLLWMMRCFEQISTATILMKAVLKQEISACLRLLQPGFFGYEEHVAQSWFICWFSFSCSHCPLQGSIYFLLGIAVCRSQYWSFVSGERDTILAQRFWMSKKSTCHHSRYIMLHHYSSTVSMICSIVITLVIISVHCCWLMLVVAPCCFA